MELWRSFIEDLRAATGQQEWDGWLAGAAELWDAEIEWDASESRLPDIGGVYRGKDAVRGFWREWLARGKLSNSSTTWSTPGTVSSCCSNSGCAGRSTGIEVSLGKYAQVATFRDGLIFRWKLYLSQAEALKPAGLRE